ncbi:hypothetical protein GCM10023115_39450 [Pontixanthobacter gangjinensis]|uniref:DUF4249 domain-containing protein n=1 Tax=Christiangramia aestuarii TaxID=1028746 RepID=A0A7K1LSC3_9FLAO|nr:DUF4249 domain-containing protein [Christiangramia aestuarii]MUP43668.1 DUF4249 domain-containing protein [Christiangramia aestuarii]
MKKAIKYLSVLILSFALFSCEEVIDLELEESEPRLVIEASIVWLKGTQGEEQRIRISETVPFYQEDTDPVENAIVRVIAENGDIYEFNHIANGEYINSSFQPVLNASYDLEVIHEGQTYTASESMMPVTSIDFVEQTESGGFAGDEIEVKAYYTDPADEENYYLFKFYNEDVTLEFYEDEFTNGNQIFGYYSNEDIAEGDLIRIEIQGISRSYYEYLFILRSQVGENDGGPFETMPATVKGNIVNRTNPENYPFGYFRLSEVDSTFYTVE